MLRAVFIMALLFSALAVAVPIATVQAKPSVPEFTVKLEAHPYYVPPAYEIDPYTGENVTIHLGYTVENKSIVITIKNILFTPYTDTNGNLIELFYHIRAKGHFEEDWTDFGHANSSDSEYVITSYALGQDANREMLREITTGDKVDFQVETQVGYYTRVYPYVGISAYREVFTGETSGWSETQTLTIGESQTPTPSPTTTPYQEPLIIGVAIAATVIVAVVVLLIYLIKRK